MWPHPGSSRTQSIVTIALTIFRVIRPKPANVVAMKLRQKNGTRQLVCTTPTITVQLIIMTTLLVTPRLPAIILGTVPSTPRILSALIDSVMTMVGTVICTVRRNREEMRT